MSATEECDKCGGYGHGPDVEEGTGIPFTCYACGASGRVPLGTYARERFEQAREAGFESAFAQDAHYERVWRKRRLGYLLAANRRRLIAANRLTDDYDDIPF